RDEDDGRTADDDPRGGSAHEQPGPGWPPGRRRGNDCLAGPSGLRRGHRQCRSGVRPELAGCLMMQLDAMPRLGPLYRRALLRRWGGGFADTSLAVAGVRVDTAHLTEYNRVCGFRQSTALPTTYPHVLAFPLALALMTGPSFPFLGVVHIANRI